MLFGGDTAPVGVGATVANDTWTFNLPTNTWTQVDPVTKPSKRSRHALGYLGGDRVLLFGGWPNGDPLDDTWVYDSGDGTWTQKNPANHPSKRYWSAMAYIAQDKVLLYGGARKHGITIYSDTWLYDLGADEWTRICDNCSPGQLEGHAMSYIGDDKVLLFGGVEPSWHGNRVCDETWLFDLSDKTWTKKASGPNKRYYSGMAYLGDDQVMMFGGLPNVIATSTLRDTWTYDLSANKWTQTAKGDANQPSKRCRFGMASLGDDQAILFSGDKANLNLKKSIWQFNGGRLYTTWNKTYAESNPRNSVGSAAPTSDGGYIMTGNNYGTGPQPDPSNPFCALWLNKVGKDGTMEWDTVFGGDNATSVGRAVQQTTDGGYFVVGDISSYTCTHTRCNAGLPSIFLIKTDANGNAETGWPKTFGSEDTFDQGIWGEQTSDGGYIVTGVTQEQAGGKIRGVSPQAGCRWRKGMAKNLPSGKWRCFPGE